MGIQVWLAVALLAVWAWIVVLAVCWGALLVFRFMGFCVGLAVGMYLLFWWVTAMYKPL